jgi:hypothetical protein
MDCDSEGDEGDMDCDSEGDATLRHRAECNSRSATAGRVLCAMPRGFTRAKYLSWKGVG